MAKKKEKKIRPIGDKILVKRMVAEEKTQGAIIIPDSCLLYTSPSPRD